VTDETELRDELYEILMEVLDLEREEIAPSSRFFQDLGGESIDLLELSFVCEKRFGVDVRFEKMLSTDEIIADENGRMPADFMAMLRSRFPFLDLAAFEEDPQASQLQGLLTVGAIEGLLRQRLAAA
jgi:acyl carrier protein